MKKRDEKKLLSDMIERLHMLKDDCIAVLAPMHVRYNNLTYEAEEGEAGETLQKQISQLEERINQMDDAHKSIESAMEFLMAVAA